MYKIIESISENLGKTGTGWNIFKNGHYLVQMEVEDNVHSQARVAVVVYKDYWKDIVN